MGWLVKKLLFVCLAATFVVSSLSFAQSPAALNPISKSELESTIGSMGLSMKEKLSLRTILQGMQAQGDKVKADGSLSAEQKAAQILKVREGALGQTQKILTAPQQQKLAALLLPKS